MRIHNFQFTPIIAGLLLGSLAACGTQQSPADLSTDEAAKLAKEAYVFGYPLVLMEVTHRVATNVEQPEGLRAPTNQFGRMHQFPGAGFRDIVKPNADTYYSSAHLDLKSEPLVLSVPDTVGRYYVLPVFDAWTNVVTSAGKRTMGTDAADFLLYGPDWEGKFPEGMMPIAVPTNLAWILGRLQVDRTEDGATAVEALQNGFALAPLSQWGSTEAPPRGILDPTLSTEPPVEQVRAMPIENYLALLSDLMVDNPPAAEDEPLVKRMATLGLVAGEPFHFDVFHEDVRDILAEIPIEVHADFEAARTDLTDTENGWHVWREGIGTYGTDYARRAQVAYFGLGANLPEDLIYAMANTDVAGEALDGSHHYVLHFDAGQEPPTKAFWSVTVYDSDGLLVANTLNRYSLGDRDELVRNEDGSVDLYLQQESPGEEMEANWLPVPAAPFSAVLRIYWPETAVLDGSWAVPPIAKQP